MDQTSILSPRTDHVTTLSHVNNLVEHCHIVSLAAALKTQFSDNKIENPIKTENSDAVQDQGRPARRFETSPYPLDLSNMESIGILPEYVDTKGLDNPNLTVYGTIAHHPIAADVARSISMVFTYPEGILVRINQNLGAALHLAWDVTPYLDDLNATLPAYHLYQLLCAFFFNRVQIGKVAVLKSMAMLGYGDVMHGHQLVRLIKDIYTYGFTSYVAGMLALNRRRN